MKSTINILGLVLLISIVSACHENTTTTNGTGKDTAKHHPGGGGGVGLRSEPPVPAAPALADSAKKFVQAFEQSMQSPMRFAISYTLDKAFMSNLQSQPVADAARVCNSVDIGGNDFYTIHRMQLVSGHLEFYQDDPRAQSRAMCNESFTACSASGGAISSDTPISYQDAKEASEKYIRQTSRDVKNSLVILKSEYDAVMRVAPGAQTLRVYHGLRGTERVVVIVGVDAKGLSIWQDKKVFVGAESHLCPTICDVL